VVGDGYLLYPNTNVFAELEEVRTHDPLERRDYVDRLDAAVGYAPGDYFKQLRDVNSPILDSLNVRYLVGRPGREAPGPKWKKVYEGTEGRVFENAQALPRVYALPGKAEISGYRESTNGAAFTARVLGGGAVLATSLVNDGGWTARAALGPMPTRRINGPFLAVELPEGTHSVELRYRPPGFTPGVIVTAATIAFLGFGTWSLRRRRTASMAAAPDTPESGASVA
jgi:membrane protein YfhO